MNVRNCFFDSVSHIRSGALVLLKSFGQPHRLDLDVGATVLLELLIRVWVENGVVASWQRLERLELRFGLLFLVFCFLMLLLQKQPS